MRNAQVPAPLGGLTPRRFLQRHWQKQALLIRQAFGGFRGLLSLPQLFALAGRDDVESRLVTRERGRWTLSHGPFRRSVLGALPPQNWTLLVQGVNLHLAAGDELLRRFAFIPYARLDDLMVSYAAPGGGVGPHYDSYDVFLLQGEGRRRWRVSRQRDLTLKPGLPLKILARFHASQDWVLEAGDMLYLPPNYAHDGVALEACTTYSIGFRAPSAQELATAFLDWLRDSMTMEGRYADPSLAPTNEPARIGAAMYRQCAAMLKRLRWPDATIARFLGCFLSEPKPMVFFVPPTHPLSLRAFAVAVARRGIHLDGRTQMLYDARNFYINGDTASLPAQCTAALKRLANQRRLTGTDANDAALVHILYRWYGNGFLHLD